MHDIPNNGNYFNVYLGYQFFTIRNITLFMLPLRNVSESNKWMKVEKLLFVKLLI